MNREEAERLVRDAEVMGVAHSIRLGKPLRVGTVVGFNLQLRDYDIDTKEVSDKTEKVPHEFVVTQSHVDEAIAQINSQKIQYKEPKMSFSGELPEGFTL